MSPTDAYSEWPDATPDNDDCISQLERCQKDAADYKDKYLRAAAQADNIRKWTERDIQARATEEKRLLLSQLLEVADNIQMALEDETGASLKQGVELTLRQLENVLSRAGVNRVPVEIGQPFDPYYQEAVEARPANGAEPHTVVGLVRPGYMHNNVLLRPARVIVAL
ncbi:MAG: nucleotide exchange factor GrpE [Omnitrophica WOR_2 bacterium]